MLNTPTRRRNGFVKVGDEILANHPVDHRENIRSDKSSTWGASFNFVNSIVGAGIIGLPCAIYQSGAILGIFLLGFVAYLVDNSVLMLIDCGLRTGKLDLEALCEHCLGRKGFYAALTFMFLFAYGAQVAYLVIVGDTVPLVAEIFYPESILTSRTIVMILSATIVMLPLCLLKDMSSLSWTSLLSIVADVVLIIIVIISAPSAAKAQGIKTAPLTLINTSLFAGIGTMSFAFVCQHNSFIVFRSLQQQTYESWKRVAHCSISFSFLLCLIFAVGGYMSFSNQTKGDLLNNFPDDGKQNIYF